MMAILIGLVFIALGAWGLFIWFPEFIFVMKGFLSVSLFLGGLISVIAGFASFRPPRSNGPPGKK